MKSSLSHYPTSKSALDWGFVPVSKIDRMTIWNGARLCKRHFEITSTLWLIIMNSVSKSVEHELTLVPAAIFLPPHTYLPYQFLGSIPFKVTNTNRIKKKAKLPSGKVFRPFPWNDESKEAGLNLKGSKQRGFSTLYNTPFQLSRLQRIVWAG